MARALVHSHMCLTLSNTHSFFILDSARTHIFRRPFVHSMIFRMNYCLVGKFSDQLNKWKYSLSTFFFSLQASRYDVYKHSGDWQQWPSSPSQLNSLSPNFREIFSLVWHQQHVSWLHEKSKSWWIALLIANRFSILVDRRQIRAGCVD